MFFRSNEPPDNSNKIVHREFPDGLNAALLRAIEEAVNGFPVVDQIVVQLTQGKLRVATITFNIYKGRG
jgi:hypothetical protein